MKNVIARFALLLAASAMSVAHAETPAHTFREHSVTPASEKVCNLTAADPGARRGAGDNILWFIESGATGAGRIGKLNVRTGAVEKFDLPKVDSIKLTTDSLDLIPGDDNQQGPCDLVLDGDKIWFNYQGANSVGFMSLKAPHKMTLVKMLSPASVPMALQKGADGNIYVELAAANKIAKVDGKTLAVNEYDVPTPKSGIVGGIAARDGLHHWFVLLNAGKLLRFNYKTQAMVEFQIPTPNSGPFVVRDYEDGLWFTMFGGNAIGHFDESTKTFSAINLPTPASGPIGVIKGLDGALYSDLAGSDKIARIDRSTKKVTEYPLPKGAVADEIKVGPDGAIWVTEMGLGKLGRLWVPSFGEDPIPSVPTPATKPR